MPRFSVRFRPTRNGVAHAGLLLVIAAFALASSAIGAEEPEGSLIVRRLAGAKPELNAEATTGVGETVYSEFDYEEVAVARLRGIALVDQHGTELAKGTLLEGRTFLGAARWCKFQPPTMWICLQDRDHDGDFDKVLILGGGRSAPHLKAAYEKEWRPSKEGFRRELLYLGAGGGVLRLTYREFVDDFARPAFTQEATYDLAAAGTTRVTFRGAEIEILEAGNSGIRYRVLSGFKAER